MEQIGKKPVFLKAFHYRIIFVFACAVSFSLSLIFEKMHLKNIFPHFSFLDDIEVMLQWRPPVVYKYLWKYVCLLAMVSLLTASLLRMVFKAPTYTAWNQSTVSYWTAFCPTST